MEGVLQVRSEIDTLCAGAVFSCGLDETHLLPKTFGVYCIRCLPTGKIYIGGTADKKGFRGRLGLHKYQLRYGRHISKSLTEEIAIHGMEAFRVYVFEETGLKEAKKREQYFLDRLQPYKESVGFNTAKFALAPSRGLKRSQKSIAAWHLTWSLKSEASKKVRGQKISRALQKHRGALSARSVAMWKDPSMRKKLTEINAREFAVQKDGEVFIGKDITAFCREHGLVASAFASMLDGKTKQGHCCGWQPIGAPTVWMSIQDPHGKIHRFYNCYELGRTQGINAQLLKEVLAGKRAEHKGWKLPGAPTNTWRVLISPTGEKEKFLVITDFARRRGLVPNRISEVLCGTREQHRGWRKAA